MKLIHKIEECDKRREKQHQQSKKKIGDHYQTEKYDFQSQKINEALALPRPYSQMKTERHFDRTIKDNTRKENQCWEASKRNSANRSEECEENLSPPDEHNYTMVKVKLNKLVPLSMDRLKERLKLL